MLAILKNRKKVDRSAKALRRPRWSFAGCGMYPRSLSSHRPTPYQTSGTKGREEYIDPIALPGKSKSVIGMAKTKAGRLRTMAVLWAGLKGAGSIGCHALASSPYDV